MKIITTHIILILLLTSIISCNSSRPVHYSKTHSYGFYHESHIYFLLDYEVWQRGRRLWFIMPFELPKKVFLREISLFRYEPDLQELEKLGVLRKEFAPAINVRYTRLTKDNSKIIFAYNAGYDSEAGPLIDLFIWDSSTGMFIDTGFENPVSRDNSTLFQHYFSDYISPWRDNPGIICFSRLSNEILQHLTNEDYSLPEKW